MSVTKNETFGMIKSLVDAHTMGINSAASLLRECGYEVVISPEKIEYAIEKILDKENQKLILQWINENHISRLGISYRLDPDDAVGLVGRIVHLLKENGLYEREGSQIKSIFFAGLTPACDVIEKEYNGRIRTFRGGEAAEESLQLMGVPLEEIPMQIKEGCKYDRELLKFGEELVKKAEYKAEKPLERNDYKEFGTRKDTIELRIDNNFKGEFQPVIRAHSGPYSAEMTREECLKEYQEWCKILAKTGYLDILSIGTSQLSQSNFGENWGGKTNGGGVPVNSEQDYYDIWNATRPMLVRTYSGTKNIREMAKIYEKTINISWHALSLWWFNELDGRGPNTLYENLTEHIETIKYIATTGKPVETNVPHHFAFRGCDDITYIVSGYLAAKLAKKCGIKTFILQNMLNTPRSTWGIQDLAKSRTLIKLVKELQDDQFRVILQTRAGLDYFKPNIEEAKVQLAAVTALMDDIDPMNSFSPEIIHVVSYSEALFLATPDILNDSIKITRKALSEYRKLKKMGETPDVNTEEIMRRTVELEQASRRIINAMEENIPDLYSAEGFYLAFVGGWLPVPDLWTQSDEFRYAKDWQTKVMNGSVNLVDQNLLVPIDKRISKCIMNQANAMYMLKHKYF